MANRDPGRKGSKEPGPQRNGGRGSAARLANELLGSRGPELSAGEDCSSALATVHRLYPRFQTDEFNRAYKVVNEPWTPDPEQAKVLDSFLACCDEIKSCDTAKNADRAAASGPIARLLPIFEMALANSYFVTIFGEALPMTPESIALPLNGRQRTELTDNRADREMSRFVLEYTRRLIPECPAMAKEIMEAIVRRFDARPFKSNDVGIIQLLKLGIERAAEKFPDLADSASAACLALGPR